MLWSRILWTSAERTTPRLSHPTHTRHLAGEVVSHPWECLSARGWQGRGQLAHGSGPDFRWLGLGEFCLSYLPSETGHSAFKPGWLAQWLRSFEPLDSTDAEIVPWGTSSRRWTSVRKLCTNLNPFALLSLLEFGAGKLLFVSESWLREHLSNWEHLQETPAL